MGGLSQNQMHKLLQRLSPQQIQMIKLLELPTVQLEQRIKREIEDNPALDEEINHEDSGPKEVDIEEYKRSEDVSSYRLRISNTSKDDKLYVTPLSDGATLSEYLNQQLSYLSISERLHTIAEYIIGSLDRRGYLSRNVESISDDLAFSVGLDVEDSEVEEALRCVQNLEPYGIGARNLQEALLLQLTHLPQTENIVLAIRVVSDFFEALAKKHFDKIIQRLNVSKEQFRDVISTITNLSPKPANLYTEQLQSEPTIQITPDFLIEKTSMGLEITLNKGNYTGVKLSGNYLDLLESLIKESKIKSKNDSELLIKEENKEAVQFIKQRVDSAKDFISAIKQRNVTLLLTMRAILKFQQKYFEQGEDTALRPMILKDISDITGLDVSTISRVVNSKYVQTEFGIYLLKYFFSEAMTTEDGDEVSSREIKSILKQCIEDEDKMLPLTDEVLMILLHEKGYKIARRTVAKYREMLEIPVARLRKSF